MNSVIQILLILCFGKKKYALILFHEISIKTMSMQTVNVNMGLPCLPDRHGTIKNKFLTHEN